MLFNSIVFFVFLAVVYVTYRLLPFRGQNWMLLVAGYVFYGWWDVRFLFLIAFSTTVDYSIALLLADRPMAKDSRLTPSIFLIAAALVFLCPNWEALSVHDGHLYLNQLLKPQHMGLEVLAATSVFVLLMNIFIIGRPLDTSKAYSRKTLICCSVFVNLTFLGFFKYFNFFIDSAQLALQGIGIDAQQLRLSVVLPVGISFYTFQSLSYTIDVYRRRIPPITRFWDFALFVAYFPPMVAGPIERARHLLPQLTKPRRVRLTQSMDGIVLIIIGLFKKMAIADGLAPSVTSVFASKGIVSQSDVALATLLFAIQIFCDFSGYSDIARGVSKLFGIELILNFNLPYFSKNPSEFWRRWHISLSSWLRDYLYVPLGGNRRGAWRTYLNLMLTMLLGGLWHGAAWNFLLWGGYQGLLLSCHRAATRSDEKSTDPRSRRRWTRPDEPGAMMRRIPWVALADSYLKIFVFFVFTCYGWLLFRASSFEQIKTFTITLLGFGGRNPPVLSKPTTSALIGVLVLIFLQVCDYTKGRLESFKCWRPAPQGLLYAVVLFVLIMGASNAPVQFIYFQF